MAGPGQSHHVVWFEGHGSYGAAVILQDGADTAVIEPAKVVYGEPVGHYELIIGRDVLNLGTLTVGYGKFSFQIVSGHHEPIHYP